MNPNLGVAMYDDKEITLADIPGLIEGAHAGVGLGIKFLKHIERCKTLLHLIDINEENLLENYKQVRNELKEYSKQLVKKEEIIVFNKIDLIDKKTLLTKKKDFESNFFSLSHFFFKFLKSNIIIFFKLFIELTLLFKPIFLNFNI